MPTDEPARNGRRPGDVSYLSLALEDVAAGERFYGALLGWTFSPGQLGREQGDDVTPQVGLWDGVGPGRERDHGAVLGFRVSDIGEAVARVRELGGRAADPARRPYGLESACRGVDGVPFFLHQLDDHPVDDGTDLTNGRRHGDVAYLTLEVPALAAAQAFYGGLFGWTFAAGSVPSGLQITGVTPMAGLWQGATPGVVPAYRVDDIAAAVDLVVQLGGTPGTVERRPYGLAADLCLDDQGVRFHLLQLP